MLVGLDLDGTIAIYDSLFHRLAAERLGMPTDVPIAKAEVRAWVRALPDGEDRWIELQSLAYGPFMIEAPSAEGVDGFLRGCKAVGVPVVIISHRTPRSVAEPAIDLHASAREWIAGHHPDVARVYLEPTRAAKLNRIRSERCAMFADDLDEVLLESTFPRATERWLYSPEQPGRRIAGVHVFSKWDEALGRVRELRKADRAG